MHCNSHNHTHGFYKRFGFGERNVTINQFFFHCLIAVSSLFLCYLRDRDASSIAVFQLFWSAFLNFSFVILLSARCFLVSTRIVCVRGLRLLFVCVCVSVTRCVTESGGAREYVMSMLYLHLFLTAQALNYTREAASLCHFQCRVEESVEECFGYFDFGLVISEVISLFPFRLDLEFCLSCPVLSSSRLALKASNFQISNQPHRSFHFVCAGRLRQRLTSIKGIYIVICLENARQSTC